MFFPWIFTKNKLPANCLIFKLKFSKTQRSAFLPLNRSIQATHKDPTKHLQDNRNMDSPVSGLHIYIPNSERHLNSQKQPVQKLPLNFPVRNRFVKIYNKTWKGTALGRENLLQVLAGLTPMVHNKYLTAWNLAEPNDGGGGAGGRELRSHAVLPLREDGSITSHHFSALVGWLMNCCRCPDVFDLHCCSLCFFSLHLLGSLVLGLRCWGKLISNPRHDCQALIPIIICSFSIILWWSFTSREACPETAICYWSTKMG